LLAQKTVRADDLLGGGTVYRRVEHEEMVADRIEPIRITPLHRRDRIAAGSEFVIKDPEANLLRGGDLLRIPRQANLHAADAPKHAAGRHVLALRSGKRPA